MTFELHDRPFPGIAASNIGAGVAVKLTTGERGVCPVGATTDDAFGVTHAVATRGEAVAVHVSGEVVKVTAAATIAAGADVVSAVASLGFAAAAAASGTADYAIGKNVSGIVGAGEKFSLFIRPRQLGGLA